MVTKDLVCNEVSAVCYYRIENVSVCYSSLAAVPSVLQALAQISVREILAHHTFTDILLDRKPIAQEIQVSLTRYKISDPVSSSTEVSPSLFIVQVHLDSVTCQWGIKVEKAEM